MGTDRSQQVPPTLVGREAQIDALHRALDAAIEKGTTVALVEAPAGFGKSALLRRFGAEVDDRATVIRIAAAEGEQQLPFGLVQQLWSALARVSADIRPAGTAADALATGNEILEMAMERVAGPVVVLADDLHWADGDSLQAMTFALRRLGAASVLAVGAFRPWPDLPEALRRLALDEGRLLTLGGLTAAQVGQLAGVLDRDLPVGASERIVDHTLGSPLHVRAVLGEMSDQELTGSNLRAPRDYSLMVMAQFARCTPTTRDLLLAAAVLGSPCELEAARRLAGVDDLPAAVDEAARIDLLACDTHGARTELRFAHPLVRSAIYDQIEPRRRLDLHRRAAEIVAGPAAVDHAVAAVLEADGELASQVADLARQDAMAGAPLVAASRFRQAARLSPDDAGHRRYLLRAVEQLLLAGDLDQSAEILDQFRGTDTEASARYLLLRGALSFFSGRRAEAVSVLERVWARRDEADGRPSAAMAAEHLAHLAALQGRGADAVAWAERAVEMWGDEAPTWAAAEAVHAVALAVDGRGADAEEVLAGWPPVEGSSVPATGRRLARGLVRLLKERPADSVPDLRAVAEHPGHRPMRERITALSHLADAELRTGAWDDAVAHGEIALGLAVDAGYTALEPVCRAVLGAALVLRGQVEEASAVLGGGPPPDPDDLAGRSLQARALGLAAHSVDDPAGVLDACLPLEQEVGAERLRGPLALLWRPFLAEALVELGRRDEARRLLDDLRSATERAGGAVSRAVVLGLDGRLAVAEGRADAALAATDEAAALVAGADHPFEEARVLEARGRVRIDLLGPGEGVADLRAAADAYRRLGASSPARRVERLLGGGAVREGLPAVSPPTSLTAREVAVADLVAAGRSNRETAAELFVSVKTVEYHLGNIYAKVGVRSRTELARRWGVGEPTVVDQVPN